VNSTSDPDELIPVSDVPEVIRDMTGGRTKVDKRTVYRWLKVGNRGARLKRCRIGKITHVKRSWLLDFILASVSEGREPSTVKPPAELKSDRPAKVKSDGSLPKWRRQQLEEANRKAEAMGLN
jgi:hypothetical protein